jgi:hypothetical protein
MNTNKKIDQNLKPNYKRLKKESRKNAILSWIEFKVLEIPKLKELSLK